VGEKTKGKVSGTLRLWGPGFHDNDMQGKGSFVIRDGDLGNASFIFKMLNLFGIPSLSSEKLTRAELQFEIKKSKFIFSKILIESEEKSMVFEADANGWVGFDGKVNVYFTPRIKKNLLENIIDLIPGVSHLLDLVKKLQSGLLKIKLTGTLDNVETTWVPLSGGGEGTGTKDDKKDPLELEKVE